MAGTIEGQCKGENDSSATRIGLSDYPAMTEGLGANDSRSDPVASFSNTMLDLRRLRAERRRIISRLVTNPNDPEAGIQLESLLRYGNRLNAQLKYRKRR